MSKDPAPPFHQFSPQYVYHSNLDQEVIAVTEDRLKLCLLENQSALTAKGQWITPLGLLISFLTTLVSADFRNKGFPAATWEAIYIIMSILMTVWLFASGSKAWKGRHCTELSHLIKQIKSRSGLEG